MHFIDSCFRPIAWRDDFYVFAIKCSEHPPVLCYVTKTTKKKDDGMSYHANIPLHAIATAQKLFFICVSKELHRLKEQQNV